MAELYEHCRLWGHSWEWLGGPPVGVELTIQGDEEWLRCTSCSTVKVIVLSLTTGYVTYTRYIWPSGYQWDGRPGEAPTKSERRREFAAARRAAALGAVPMKAKRRRKAG